jgi:hypothetical protein
MFWLRTHPIFFSPKASELPSLHRRHPPVVNF